MLDSPEKNPRPISEILPEVVDALEHDKPIEPNSNRRQRVIQEVLGAEIAELKAEREEIGRAIVGGGDSEDLRQRFEEVSLALLDAQAEHIQTYGTVGGVPSRE